MGSSSISKAMEANLQKRGSLSGATGATGRRPSLLAQSGGGGVLEAAAETKASKTEATPGEGKVDPWQCYDEMDMQVEMSAATSERRASVAKAMPASSSESTSLSQPSSEGAATRRSIRVSDAGGAAVLKAV